MRLALVSLIALAAGANAFAQAPAATTDTAPAAPPAATPAPPPPPPASTMAPAAPAASTPAPTPATSPPVTSTEPTSATAPPSAGAPATAPIGGTTPTAETPPPPPPPPPPSPPPPPPPPTDPTTIAVLDVLQRVCIPAASGGNFAQIAKAYGLRKQNGDLGGWGEKQKDFTLVVEDPGSNPNQCHVDLTHPADLEAPGRPIIIALNDSLAVEHGWSLYRNDKNVQGNTQFTTRSWQLDWNGSEQSVVFTTMRKPDGTPTKGAADTSQLIYETIKSPS
jgi:hypothetical protein